MKKLTVRLQTIGLIAALVAFSGCNDNGAADANGSNGDTGAETSQASIEGEWKLVNFESNGSTDVYTDCDGQTVWNFTDEAGEALSDGTETRKIVVTAPDVCEYYDFESQWAQPEDGQLFIASTRVGGMGGRSNAGLFEIQELSDNRMVIKAMSNIYTFERA